MAIPGRHYCSVVPSGDRVKELLRGPAPAWLRTGRPALHRLMHNRRQALLALGGGAVALAGLSAGAAVVFQSDEPDGGDSDSPKNAGSFSDRDASYVSAVGDLNNLGAAGLAATPSAAAAAAMRATP